MEQAKTKREVLATSASIFDPLGMITPVTFKIELFLQELWQKKKEWDKRISNEQIMTWKGIMADLNGISSTHLPRFVGNGSSQLLCFCNSSSKAYATVIYLRTKKKKKKNSVSFIFSKARSAHKKKLTIPRLEFMSVLIGARSLHFVAKAMTFENAE